MDPLEFSFVGDAPIIRHVKKDKLCIKPEWITGWGRDRGTVCEVRSLNSAFLGGGHFLVSHHSKQKWKITVALLPFPLCFCTVH